jgi:hypothetical protein
MANNMTLQNLSANFKVTYGGVTNTVNVKTPALSTFKKNKSANWSGTTYEEMMILGTGVGLGARGTGEMLPGAGVVPTIRVSVTAKSLYSTIGYDRQALIAGKGKDAFVKATLLQTEQGVQGFSQHLLERGIFGDSSGQLGEIAVGTVTGAGTVASPWSFNMASSPVNASSIAPQGAYFTTNQRIDLFSFAGLYQMTLQVVGVSTNTATKVVTVTAVTISTGASLSPANTDGVGTTAGNVNVLYWEKNRGKEFTGLMNVSPATPGVLYGQSQTSYPALRGLYVPVSGAIGPADINSMVESIAERCGEAPNLSFCSFSKYAELKNALEDAKMYEMSTIKSTDGKIGFSGMKVESDSGSFSIMKSQFCPNGEMHFVNTKYIQLILREDFGWFNEDGNVLSKVPNFDQYQATYGGYGDFFFSMPNAFGRLKEV